MTQAMEIFDFFLRNDPNVSILEENEFNKNINIKAQDDERNSDQKDLIKETMIETIVKYQSILGKCKTEEERKILQNLMNIIKQQLNTFLKTESSVNTIPSATFIEVNQEKEKKQLIKEEISPIISKKPKAADRAKKNEEGLKDIFVFIAKQGHVVGKNSTFERVQHESQILSLGEFFFFCKTFNLYNENFDKNVIF